MEQANTIAAPMIFPFLTAGSILLKKVPDYFLYFKKFSLFYYGAKMLSKGQWQDVGTMRCMKNGEVLENPDCPWLWRSFKGPDILVRDVIIWLANPTPPHPSPPLSHPEPTPGPKCCNTNL